MSLLEECCLDCPYCGEPISVLVDCSIDQQTYVEDCQVCCRPIVLQVAVDEQGYPQVYALREDE
ncbi:CPXCG motif-containing cysteine-rich protein [Cellvibrio sp. KY-GH-1]|uniref:CPXCG motif-containing cysteine-rich protein n=1 Tax=Cellvibrio sp. KY-GH-1 TaxID=2303332 RepID=UPI001247A4C8|nr:CPXCG motif-containing cysteine-rich protein [Cellvibrio sp. KY-GH-1]QEY17036.1 CPXCG motif-containing cysteine-rich protein [Cellvibrio sp. KY-GH-1]